MSASDIPEVLMLVEIAPNQPVISQDASHAETFTDRVMGTQMIGEMLASQIDLTGAIWTAHLGRGKGFKIGRGKGFKRGRGTVVTMSETVDGTAAESGMIVTDALTRDLNLLPSGVGSALMIRMRDPKHETRSDTDVLVATECGSEMTVLLRTRTLDVVATATAIANAAPSLPAPHQAAHQEMIGYLGKMNGEGGGGGGDNQDTDRSGGRKRGYSEREGDMRDEPGESRDPNKRQRRIDRSGAREREQNKSSRMFNIAMGDAQKQDGGRSRGRRSGGDT
ncbi:hypothetical protein CALCODRAFT_485478 [Calocera cornea HHB12733]|uniref:Uncharacterized protein n=1 Tax=Calocera cornea HHB12733 TaxID=1353952 RepID=A0A165EBR3_9BASI|nr:hypothetical protein CALCODRAFT_485478 [Calocera cornea HHB12733]